MPDANMLPAPKAGAGVLDLLRAFRTDQAAADRYAATCLEKTRDVEPKLKAFEYLPTDTKRRPGPLSGIPVAIKDIIATSDMPTTNGSPIYKGHVPARDAARGFAARRARVVRVACPGRLARSTARRRS